MTTNMGAVDRGVRMLIGLALIAWALGFMPGQPANLWGWVGLIPLGTSLVGWCPAYKLLGVSTCGRGA